MHGTGEVGVFWNEAEDEEEKEGMETKNMRVRQIASEGDG